MFNKVLQRVIDEPASEAGRVFTGLVRSLLNGEPFNAALVERLSDADRVLCTALFESCLRDGLSEENRQLLSQDFASYIELHSFGTRH